MSNNGPGADLLMPRERDVVRRIQRTPLRNITRADCFELVTIVNRLAPDPQQPGTESDSHGQ